MTTERISKGSNKRRYWRSVFRRVLACYDEIKAVYAQTPAISYERFVESVQAPPKPVGVVVVSAVEFIAEFELAAKRALTTELERFFFDEIYVKKNDGYKRLLQMEWGEEKFTEYKHTIQEKIGRILAARKIHPVGRYLKARDLR